MAVFTLIVLLLRSIVFRALDGHARSAIHDPKEDEINLTSAERENLCKSKKILVKKYKKYIWHGSAYAIMLMWGLRILYLAPWSVFNQLTFDYMSIGWPHHRDHQEMPALIEEFHILAMSQLAWYFAGGIENVIHDRSRGDFWMMIVHHFLTILLIYGAFVSDAHRCAVHITVILDISDVTMYYCKTFHLRTSTFEGKAKPGRSFHHLLHLGGLAVCWLVTRLYFYGLAILTMWYHNPFEGCPFSGSYLKVFLSILWVQQFIWGIAICKMVVDLARKGEFEDNLSGDVLTIKQTMDSLAIAEDAKRRNSNASTISPSKADFYQTSTLSSTTTDDSESGEEAKEEESSVPADFRKRK